MTFAGTDNDVTLVLLTTSPSGLQERAWNLDNEEDNFERGKLDSFNIVGSLPAQICDIKGIAIRKSHGLVGRFGHGLRRLVPLGRRQHSGHRPRDRLRPEEWAVIDLKPIATTTSCP